jgi:hypothetical protein
MNATKTAFMLLVAALTMGCRKAENAQATSGLPPSFDLGCDHDVEIGAVAKHSWPFPEEYRNLRWGNQYRKVRLKLKPTSAAFFTATVTWKEGELIEVEDSDVVIVKPRRLVAKRDLFVTRKVWEQGIHVQRRYLAVAQGEVGSFLFYNSRGMCMVGTDSGPAWTPCTLDDAFEGLSETHPDACEQAWWVKVRKSKVEQGWMPVDLSLMERVPPTDAAR